MRFHAKPVAKILLGSAKVIGAGCAVTGHSIVIRLLFGGRLTPTAVQYVRYSFDSGMRLIQEGRDELRG